MLNELSASGILPTDIEVDRAIAGPAFPLPAYLTTDGFSPLGVLDTLHLLAIADDATWEGQESYARLVTVRNEVRRDMWRAQEELQEFRDRVRDIAIEAHRNGDFCESGMNAAFDRLGLERYAPEVQVEFTVRVTATVSGLDADDAADAVWAAVESVVDNLDELDDGVLESITSGRLHY